MMRLYSDEDITVGFVANLRQRGFCVLSTRDAHRLQLDDDAQLAFAVAARRPLVTHNRHGSELFHERNVTVWQTHYGIVIASRRANDDAVVAGLLALLDSGYR